MHEPLLEIQSLRQLLASLVADQTPLWGSLTPQHMIEHLSTIITFSNGKAPQQLHSKPEKVEGLQAYLMSDKAFPRGFRSPALPPEGLPPLTHQSLAEAIETFLAELAAFKTYFEAKSPDHREMHPVFGNLNYTEWIVLHRKHFQHHFSQFKLIEA